MTHKWSKTRIPRSDSTQFNYYSPYSSKIQVLDSTPSRILGHYLAYYLTPNIGRISNIFRIARLGRVIRRGLILTISDPNVQAPDSPLQLLKKTFLLGIDCQSHQIVILRPHIVSEIKICKFQKLSLTRNFFCSWQLNPINIVFVWSRNAPLVPEFNIVGGAACWSINCLFFVKIWVFMSRIKSVIN